VEGLSEGPVEGFSKGRCAKRPCEAPSMGPLHLQPCATPSLDLCICNLARVEYFEQNETFCYNG
jgi:hypothetical protein